MRKSLIGALAPLAAMAGIVGAGTAQAAETPDQLPTTASMNAQWNEGGAAVGGGAAQMVSAAFFGVPGATLGYTGAATGLYPVEFVDAQG